MTSSDSGAASKSVKRFYLTTLFCNVKKTPLLGAILPSYAHIDLPRCRPKNNEIPSVSKSLLNGIIALKEIESRIMERKVLSAVFPAHADLQPILKEIREKYGLPKLGLMDKEVSELLLADKDIPWGEIKQEIRTRVETHPEIWPEGIQNLRKIIQNNQSVLDNPDTFIETGNVNQEQIRSATMAISNLIKPMAEADVRMVDNICELLFFNLATGETRDIPLDWLGAVYTTSILGEPVVVAMASQLSNPKEIIERFTAEIHRVFGKDRPTITEEFKNTADYLRMKFEGVPLKDIADEYMLKNPSKFTKDLKSSARREQRRRLVNRLKKAFQRNEEKLLKLIGDNSKT